VLYCQITHILNLSVLVSSNLILLGNVTEQDYILTTLKNFIRVLPTRIRENVPAILPKEFRFSVISCNKCSSGTLKQATCSSFQIDALFVYFTIMVECCTSLEYFSPTSLNVIVCVTPACHGRCYLCKEIT